MTTSPAATRAGRHSVFHRLQVSSVERLIDDAVAVTFDVPSELADEYRFAAGQHVNVSVPGGDEVRRSYSICAPAGSGRLRIAVKRIPDGTFSSYALSTLAPGDELDVMTPAGRFTPPLDPANAKHYVAIAAGSGITPVMSIVATILDEEPESRVTLIYGNRTSPRRGYTSCTSSRARSRRPSSSRGGSTRTGSSDSSPRSSRPARSTSGI